MKYKKIMFMLVLAVFLLSITCVSASEIDDTLASEDTNTIGLSVDKDIIEDNLQTSEENNELALTDNDEAIAQTDTEVLGADSATYFDLAAEIGQPGNINLIHKNYTYDGGEPITILEDNKVIDGNGAVIDMNGSTIRAFYISGSGVTIKNLTIKNVNYNGNGGAIYFGSTGTVTNCNFTNNTARYGGGGVYFSRTGEVTNCNFTDNTATYHGGAIYFLDQGTVTNCNFTDNTATYYSGAVYFNGNGEVTKCNFTDNTATYYSGAVYFNGNGEVTKCNFTNNTAKMGNAIYINNKCTISDCDFTNNPITKGAIHSVTGDITLSNNIINVDDVVSDKNFTEIQKLIDRANDGDEITINGLYAGFGIPIRITKSLTLNGQNNTTLDAKKLSKTLYITANNVIIKNIQFTSGYADYGGAIYFYDDGSVSNCNFTDNTATDGGAVYFQSTGNVTNCNFTNNKATADNSYGGAIYMYSGTVTNCNFTNNTAGYDGGAIDFESSGTVTNCNFTNNNAYYGGAIWFTSNGNVTNCNFTNNTAGYDGGAIYFAYGSTGTVENCNFTGNNANWGSAIYFYKYYSLDTLTVSDSTFLNNRANAGALDIVKTENNITITFTGQNNLLNAIYSINDAEVTFNNVTYWGAKGITTISATMSGSNKEEGQNITVGVVVNNELVLSDVIITNENGTIVLPMKIESENYYIGARHDKDSYYTEAEKTISNNMKFSVNVTSQTANNKTVNITAKSNIFSEVMPGKLLFILSDGTADGMVIEANYAGNGTWWAKYTFADYGEYKVNATYVGLDNVTINNGTITINKVNSTITLDDVTLDYGESKNVTVTTTGATGIKANINGTNVTVINNYTILISDLAAGNYTLTVTTIPDKDYNPVTATSKITINKVESTLTVDNIEFDYNSEGSCDVSFTGASQVIANVVNQSSAVVSVSGNKISVSGLGAGTYTLNVTTVPDENHTAVTETAGITVNKINSTLTLEDVELDYGESKNITVAAEGATGITAKIDGVDVTVSNYTIPISGLSAGNYTLTVTTIPDKNHNPVTKEANITVNKVESTLTVGDIVFDYNSEGSGDVSFTGASEVTANVVNQPSAVISVNGKKISVSGLGAGTYTLNVTTVPDENHTAVTETAGITVNKINSTLTLEDVELDYGESKNITVTTEGATGITAKIDGVDVTVNNYTIPISGLGAGNYTLTVTTIADKNHNPVTKEANITVNKLSTEIILANETLDLKVGDEVPVLVNLTPAGAGNLTFTSSDEDLVFVEDNVTIVANSQGQAIITVSFAGNENYTAAENKTITVNVALNDASVSVDNDTLNLKVDETSAINATIKPDTIMLKIKYTSSNESVATVDKNGIVTAVGEGTAIITLEVGDNEIYAKNSTTVTVNVKDNTVNVSASDLTKYYNGPESFVVIVTDSRNNPLANQSVIISVAGVNYTRTTDVNGTASIAIGLISGQYNVTTIVGNNTVYSTVTVLPTVNATDLVKVFRNATQFYATFKDSKGNYLADGTMVRFNINGVMYDRKISGNNGLAKLNINLEQGQYIITSMNLETGENAANNVTVISRLIENKELVKYYRNATQYTVKVIDDNGKAVGAGEIVTFNVNGVLYNRTTDESGIAKLNINLHPGDYIITAEYKDCRVSNNIKVLPVLTADDLTKKYGTPDQFIATLVDGQGNPFAGETVQFNVNGIFYNRVTDSNGQSKLNIRLMPGKYVITSSYNGTNIANTITISA